MSEMARRTLAMIITRHARPPALDVRRCEGLLRDYLRGEYRKEINVLVSALREQVVADLLASGGTIPTAVLLTRCARKLYDQTGIAEDLARWSVESWALALGVIAQEGNIIADKTLPTNPVSTEQKSGLYINCSCGKRARIPEAAYGRRVRCPSCRRTFTAPKPESPLPHVNDEEPLPGALAPTDPIPESQQTLNSWGILPPLARLAPADPIPESQPTVSPQKRYPAGLGVFVPAPPVNLPPTSSPPSPPAPAVPESPFFRWIGSLKEGEGKQPAAQSHWHRIGSCWSLEGDGTQPAAQSHPHTTRTNEVEENTEKSADDLKCAGCGVSKALARSWYSTSPITGKRIGWCDCCYEQAYARHISSRISTAPQPASLLPHASEPKPLPGALAPKDAAPESQPSVVPHKLHPAGLGAFVSDSPDNPYPVLSPPSLPAPAVPSDDGTPFSDEHEQSFRQFLLVAVLFSGMGAERLSLYLGAILEANDKKALIDFLKTQYARCRPIESIAYPLAQVENPGKRVSRKVVEEPSPWQEYAIRVMEDNPM